jgi:hypothetical protein
MNCEQLLLGIRDEAQQALERVDLRGEKIDCICYLIRCLREEMKWTERQAASEKQGT